MGKLPKSTRLNRIQKGVSETLCVATEPEIDACRNAAAYSRFRMHLWPWKSVPHAFKALRYSACRAAPLPPKARSEIARAFEHDDSRSQLSYSATHRTRHSASTELQLTR